MALTKSWSCDRSLASQQPARGPSGMVATPRWPRDPRWQYQDEWRLDPEVFRHFDRLYGPHRVDLLASRLTTQLRRYVSKFPDPGAEGVDAFSRSWGGEVAWVNPRWDDLSRVAHTLRTTPSAAATVVAPGKYFSGQPWFQELRAILAH